MNALQRMCAVLALLAAAIPAGAAGSPEPRSETVPVEDGVPAVISVTAGEHFTHKLRVMPLIRVSNAPQMAAWCESEDGEFLTTLYITDRLATQSWRGAPADPTPTEEIRRPESLPVWAHRHGDVYADGLRVPTAEDPMPDAVTSATPQEGFEVRTLLPDGHDVVRVHFEVNHSADFNEAYPPDAAVESDAYSGGEWGSGQPALVYSGLVDLGAGNGPRTVKLMLRGHASPDGTSGRINEDLGGITTARHIVDSVRIRIVTSE